MPDIPNEADEEDDDTLTKNIPPWAQWEELEKTLQAQASVNPQEIFGGLPALDISSMLPLGNRGQQPRLSSQWGAADQLTPQEIVKYNADMGWSTEH